MKPKIICDTCGLILSVGDIGGGVQTKRCLNCVMKRSDAAPQNRLLKVNGTKLIGIKEEKNKPLKLKLFYKFLEPDENNPVEKLMWIVAIEIYEQRTLMEVAFSKEDLLKVIEDMGNYEKEKVLS